MPIIPDDDVVLLGGNTPEDIEEVMEEVPAGTLVVFRTEVWTNDVPEVTTVGTNIIARFKGLTDADTEKATFEWSETSETGPWSVIEPNFKEICAVPVWCKVTCPNYVATNAVSGVYIKSRESKPDDEEAEEEDKLQPNPDPTKPTTEEQTEKVVEAIAANDNRNPGYDPTKPVWDGEGTMSGGDHGIQTDAKVNLKVTSIGNLPDDEEEKAEEHRTNEVAKAEKEAGVAPGTLESRNIDVKLLYTRTYSDGTKSDPVNIGASNEEIIPFTIAVELEENEKILKIVRYHGETRDEIYEGTNPALEHFELSADRKYVTVYAKTYSEFILIWGLVVPKPVYKNSALLPLPYEYKASVKHMYLKEIKISTGGFKGYVYAKYLKAAALKGYLIVDMQGATSQAMIALSGYPNAIPGTAATDYGANRAFLVVQNSKAEKAVRTPKVLPAVLDAKWLMQKSSATSGPAEGYLYVGGDIQVGQVREAFDKYNSAQSVTRTANAALGFIEDYCWTSMHLFGQCNGPLFITGLRDNAEAAIDAAQEAGLQQPFAAGNYFFHDSWMNGAGFGKWSLGKNTKACCGATQAAKKVLSTLSGTLKGGLFLCTENLTNLDAGYLTVNNADWEDQFFCCRDSQNDAHFGTWSSAGDFDQTDLWQDGGLELNTRDCISGTWSIRLCNDFFVKVYKAVTPEEIEALADGYPITQNVEAAAGLYNVVGAIKGSVLKLDKSAKFIETGSGNKEIFTIVQPGSAEKLPSVTPKFAQHFGLANWL